MLQNIAKPPVDLAMQIWPRLRDEATSLQGAEPLLARYANATILSAPRFDEALGNLLAEKLAGHELNAAQIRQLFTATAQAEPDLIEAACRDLSAVVDRDPAAGGYVVPFLFFKGFHALQAYRLSHWLWRRNRRYLAFYLQNRISDLFAVDIHPAARIGSGIMMDHATGIVIGETAVVEDNVSMLHAVTLGGTGKETGDRVMIGAGAKILGNIEVGSGARVAAGSVVLQNVPPCVTVAGVPAKVVGNSGCAEPSQEMNQMLPGDCISI